MRHSKVTWALAAIIASALAYGCDSGGKAGVEGPEEATEDHAVDATMYGRCGEGTSMHHLELVRDNGDTLSLALLDDEETGCVSDVQGGLHVGDRLAVMASRDYEGRDYAGKVVNLVSLLGKWSSFDASFEIREGGVVAGGTGEGRPYTEWRILNGFLVLSADTFDIFHLGPDSLFLDGAGGMRGFRRVTREL